MKNIAVFTYNFTVEYATSVLKGIYRYFENQSDVRVYYAQTKLPNASEGFFEYQYWAAAEFLNTDSIDEIIIVSNSYFYYIEGDEFIRTIFPFKNKKLVSIGFDLQDENTFYSTTDCTDAYDEIVGHLKDVHGCKKFAFFSANNVGSPEAFERYNAYKKALEKHGIEFDEKRIYNGNYTSSSVHIELTNRIKSRDDIDFDVIICANDLMAVGCVDFFFEMGISVPDDIKVVGFDNTSHAALCNPSLTTIDPSIEQQGYDAAEMGLKLLASKKKFSKRSIYTPLQIRYRHSCGCLNKTNVRNMDSYRNLISYYDDISKIDFCFDFVRGASSLSEIATSIEKVGYMFGFSTISAFMYENPFPLEKNEIFEVPKSIRFVMHLDFDSNTRLVVEDGEIFNPHERILPSFFEEQKILDGGQFILQPIFLGEVQYGYLVCKLRRPTFAVNGVVLKIITSALAQGYDYTKTMRRAKSLDTANQTLTSHNIDLKIKSNTDELTGSLNRRGFLNNAQKVVSFAVDLGMNGLVFFADLDGLKTINDNFGHEYGDVAIKLQTKVLKEAFRQTDVVGRLSGDEFGIVSIGMDIDFVDKMRAKIEELDEQYSKENNLPFELSISIGAAHFDAENQDLADLLKRADADLYEQKKIHHARQKKH